MIADYGLFLAKGLTGVILLLILVGGIAGISRRDRDDNERLRIKKRNDHYQKMEKTLGSALKPPRSWRERLARMRASTPSATDDPERPNVFVLRFEGDIRANRVESLREEVTAVLTQARPGIDRVVLLLNSPGGLVPGYGLAASQLARLREAGIELIVCVDRVAASGGYLMAAVANRIVATPFAIVGSIGVVAQIPNVNRLLKRHDVDVELLTAGEYKRTLTVLGKNTEEGRRKFQEDLEATHQLFKLFLHRYRPGLDLERVATGEYWHGEQALPLGLVDEINTSDDLLLTLSKHANLFEIDYYRKQRMGKRLTLGLQSFFDRALHSNRST